MGIPAKIDLKLGKFTTERTTFRTDHLGEELVELRKRKSIQEPDVQGKGSMIFHP